MDDLFGNAYGAIVCEISADADIPKGCKLLGKVTDEYALVRDEDVFSLTGVFSASENRTAYPDGKRYLYLKEINDSYGTVRPADEKRVKVLIPVTGYSVPDDAIVSKFNDLGASVILYNLTESNITEFVKRLKSADILFLTDTLGSEGFINTVLSKRSVVNEINALRERGGLVYGYGTSAKILITNGLVELDTEKFKLVTLDKASLRGEYVMLTLASQLSPFTRNAKIGNSYKGYVYGKSIKLYCDADYADELAREGRIITQYGVGYNRIDSDASIDSVCSRDGRVLAQMSVPYTDESCLDIAENAMKYFLVF
jgi:phosphoribosylformylglycinamidine synthase